MGKTINDVPDGYEPVEDKQINLADALTDVSIETEGLLPGQTPIRITNETMRKWNTIQGVPIDRSAKIPKDRKNFFFVSPGREGEVIKKQWQNYFKNPQRYGLTEDSTIEDAVKTFDQERPANKTKLLRDRGIDPTIKIKDARKRFDLSALNPFSVTDANADEVQDAPEGYDSVPEGFEEVKVSQASDAPEGFEEVPEGYEELSTELSTGVDKEKQPNNAVEIAKGGLRGLQGIASGTGGLIDMAGQNIQREAEKMLFVNQPGVSKEERSKKAESLSKIGKKVSEWGKTAKDFWTKASQEGIAAPDPEMFTGSFMQKPSWTRAATIVAEAVPSLGAATAASMAAGGNPMVGLAFLGSIEGEQTFSEARSAGKNVDDANRFFGMAALGTSVLEALPLTRFLKGGEGKLAKDAFIGAVQEGSEEGLQNLWQNVIAKIGYDKTRSLTEGMVESVIGGAGSGGVVGGLTSGRAAKLDKEIKQAIDAGVPQVAIDAMQETVANQIVANAEEVEKAITTKPVSTDVAEVKDNLARDEQGKPISVNITPEMESALEKSNLSEERRGEIIKLLETPDTATTKRKEAETKPATSVEAKGEEAPPIISEEAPSVNQDQKRLEGNTDNVKSEEVKPQDSKTSEEIVSDYVSKTDYASIMGLENFVKKNYADFPQSKYEDLYKEIKKQKPGIAFGESKKADVQKPVQKQEDAKKKQVQPEAKKEPGAIRAFHTSKVKGLKKFDRSQRTGLSPFGFHFGTKEQAEFRAGQYDFKGDAETQEFVLNIKNPLRVPHMASFAPDHLSDVMMDLRLITDEQYQKISEDAEYEDIAIGDKLIPILKKAGYDGLVYENEREGKGDSYVVFDEENISPVSDLKKEPAKEAEKVEQPKPSEPVKPAPVKPGKEISIADKAIAVKGVSAPESVLRSIVPKKGQIHALEYVLIEDGKYQATDLDIGIQIDGATKPDGVYEFVGKDIVKSSMPLTKDDFPRMPIFLPKDVKGSADRSELIDAIERASVFTSDEKGRETLAGIFFDVNRIVATDGRRLIMIPIKTGIKEPFIIDLPDKVAKALGALSGNNITISENTNGIQFSGDNGKVTIRKIESDFPRYDQVIKIRMERQVSVDKKKALAALKEIQPYLKRQGKDFVASVVTMSQDGKSLVISTQKLDGVPQKSVNIPLIENKDIDRSTNYPEGLIILPMKLGTSYPEAGTFGMNADYIVDAIKATDSNTVYISMGDNQKAWWFGKTEDDGFYSNEPATVAKKKQEVKVKKDDTVFIDTINGDYIEFITDGGVKKQGDVKYISGELHVIPDGTNNPIPLKHKNILKLLQRNGRKVEGKGSSGASVGTFTEELQFASAKTDIEIKPIETIELVRLAKTIMDEYPTLKNFPKARGMFYGEGKGSIKLVPDLFKRGQEKQLASTLAHEIGHLVDYLPDRTLNRGNLLGRIATLRDYMKNFLPKLSSVDPEGSLITPEDREAIKKTVEKEIGTRPADSEDLKAWRKVKKEERGPRPEDNAEVKEWKRLRSERYAEEIIKAADARGLVTQKALRDEMIKLSFEWRPIAEGADQDESYMAYRSSGKEIYADTLSALLNNPGYVQQKAPTFFELFFEYIDRKPEFKQAYIAAQKMMNGTPEEIMAARQQDIRTMFVKGENIRENLEEQAKKKENNLYERLRQWLDDKYFPLTNKLEKGKRNGVIPTSDAAHLLQELDLWQNDAYALTKEIDRQVLAPLKETTATMADLSEFMFLKRIIGKTSISADDVIAQLKAAGLEDFLGGLGIDIVDTKEEAQAIKAQQTTRISDTGMAITEEIPVTSWEEQVQKWKEKNADREDLANPLGFDTATAQKQIDYLKKQIGDEAFAALEQSADKYHDLIFKIMEDAVAAGVYSSEVFEKVIRPNKNYYVTFGVLDYLDNSVPAGIKSQRGTLKEVESPFITTILKTISLIRANAKNRAVSSGITQLAQQYPLDANESKRIIIGGVPARFANPKKGLGQVRFLKEGKLVSYDVDQYIAESFANDTPTMTALGANLNKFLGNRFFKGLVITYSPAFQIFNIQRDFKRTYINLNALGKNVSIKDLLGAYWKALPVAVRRMTGADDALIAEMMTNKALDIPFNDFNFDDRDDGFARILRKYNVIGDRMEAKTVREKLVKVVMKVDAAVRFVGNIIETLPKVAGYNIMKEKGASDRDLGYVTREYLGTPNFRNKGSLTRVTNELFVFSNIALQGIKADMRLATRPTTRSGYWWADFKVNYLPKLLMIAAIIGLAGKDLEDWFEKVPEYDKTNFLIIPMGYDDQGRAKYLRLPHNETSRMLSAIIYKTGTSTKDKKDNALASIFSVSGGILPGISPAISIATSWGQYLGGRNPYDDFRGRPLISERAFEAGGMYSLSKMVEHTFNDAGFSQFTTYDDRRDTTFEAMLKGTPFINSMFRIVKTSDYGLTEKAMAEVQKDKAETARRNLKRDEMFEKRLKGFRADQLGNLLDENGRIKQGSSLYRDIYDISLDLYAGEPTKEDVQTTAKAFIRFALREQNNPYVKSVLNAQSNDTKVKILQEAKNELPVAKYNEMALRLRRTGIVSKEVFRQIK